eukprot:NODE_60_length_25605_cov_0.732377.p1 type:complete len:787 gc:universal NODE_60_length_25605_cov_0.732377:21144-23504(+)
MTQMEDVDELAIKIDTLVNNILSNTNLQSNIDQLRSVIKASTTSMVPKPLKYLMQYYEKLTLVKCSGDDYKLLQDILSFISMTVNDLSLLHRINGGFLSIDEWGHEYVKHLSGNCISYFEDKDELGDLEESKVKAIVNQIVPYFLKNNAEIDAIDLLIEMNDINHLLSFIPDDLNTVNRIGLYLLKMTTLLPPPEDVQVLLVLYELYLNHNICMSLIMAIKLRNVSFIDHCFSVSSPLLQAQLAFILSRDGFYYNPQLSQTVCSILSNTNLSKYYIEFATNLDLLQIKTPEDVYKQHLESRTTSTDSNKHLTSSAIVNGLINIGYKSNLPNDDHIHKCTDFAKLCSIASIGSLYQWDIDGLNQIDKYMYNENEFISSGAYLAIGLTCIHIKHDSDPCLALLQDALTNPSLLTRSTAIMGLGCAYAGTNRMDVLTVLLPFITDTSVDMDLTNMAGIALGLIFVGSCHEEISSAILQCLMSRPMTDVTNIKTRYLYLGLALLFLQQQDKCNVVLDTLQVLEYKEIPIIMVKMCAYANTGNIMKIQELLQISGKEHGEYAIIGIALMSNSADGIDMALRMFNHMMQFGSNRQAVPLAIGLLSASTPKVQVMDVLGKFSHDSDLQVASNAIFGMGLVGCGTNNARLAHMLRNLASYYYKDSNMLFMIRVAQGMVHMGKGIIGINMNYNEHLTTFTGTAGLLACLMGVMNTKLIMEAPFLLYFLNISAYPKYCMTLDSDLEMIKTNVRVGQGLDVVGQAGKGKRITGFQTYESPVLVNYGERVELATDQCK